ncbi:hypothetical protein EDD15DRAFT_2366218 [Pisolithus albus]|nr:hypothetical protein EDD15DRAFT_2377106 [Pisolithus albus]KAI5994696.1 hypothetical protein EDD15DRAFT_2366218 [Pisolithus albus]
MFIEQATATSTGRGAQDDQEEFRAASPKDAEKSTGKSEPKLDPEPHPTTVSDGKGVDAVEAESDGVDPMFPLPTIGAVDGINLLNIGAEESEELRTQSRKERADVFTRNVTVHSGFRHQYE